MTDFSPRPSLGAPGTWAFPTAQRTQLDNGLTVLSYALPGQYVVAAHLVLPVPLASERRDREGVATVCTRSLDEGTRRHGGEEFAEALETEGAGFGVDVSLSGLQLILDVPTSRLSAAMELFAEAATEPALADADVNRHVQLRLAEIEQAQANSAQVAAIAFRSAVFDPGTRAARMTGGEPETVAAVTPAAAREFFADHFGPGSATLVLAGDFRQDPAALAEQVFGSWQQPASRPAAPEVPTPGQRQALLIDRPGAVQADVRLGAFGPDRLDPRWADLSVASFAMGGAFLSRLNAVLREQRGYTYGVRFNLTPLRHGGSFALQGSFRTEVVADALRAAQELLDIRSAPFTATEVAEAVAYYAGVSPLRYATADGVADQAATQVLMGLDEDYVNQSLAALRRVSPDSATAAYSSLVDLPNLTLVVVGDAEQLADPLRAAGYSELEVRPAP